MLESSTLTPQWLNLTIDNNRTVWRGSARQTSFTGYVILMFDQLDDTNFLLYAAKHYDNPQCYDTIEFYDDLKRFKYIKRLFNIYQETGDLREQLILNHIIILYNLFGVVPTTRMLFFKLFDYKEYLKPFLEFLNYMPDKIISIGIQSTNILSKDIVSDNLIEERLREI